MADNPSKAILTSFEMTRTKFEALIILTGESGISLAELKLLPTCFSDKTRKILTQLKQSLAQDALDVAAGMPAGFEDDIIKY